jgi:transcriptional antiterminator NusG
VENEAEKLQREALAESASGETRDRDTSAPASPVEGDPADDGTTLARGNAGGLSENVDGEMEEVLNTSEDPEAAREALEDAERMLEDMTGDDDDDEAYDETPSSDDTVMENIVDESSEEDFDEIDDEDEANAVPVRTTPRGPIELDVPEEEEINLQWYILKVQSNRERSIADALKRKIAIEGLDKLFGQVLVPTEKVTEFKGGKKKIVERKLWPGYIAVQMHVNDDTWFAIRETSGIGDFTGSAGKPSPMQPHEIALILQSDIEVAEEAPKLDIKFSPGDKVKVMEGNFENFEGEVSMIDEAHGRVTVMLSIFGRPTPVELEYWQVEVI